MALNLDLRERIFAYNLNVSFIVMPILLIHHILHDVGKSITNNNLLNVHEFIFKIF